VKKQAIACIPTHNAAPFLTADPAEIITASDDKEEPHP